MEVPTQSTPGVAPVRAISAVYIRQIIALVHKKTPPANRRFFALFSVPLYPGH
jgi:hypothetical protein